MREIPFHAALCVTVILITIAPHCLHNNIRTHASDMRIYADRYEFSSECVCLSIFHVAVERFQSPLWRNIREMKDTTQLSANNTLSTCINSINSRNMPL